MISKYSATYISAIFQRMYFSYDIITIRIILNHSSLYFLLFVQFHKHKQSFAKSQASECGIAV